MFFVSAMLPPSPFNPILKKIKQLVQSLPGYATVFIGSTYNILKQNWRQFCDFCTITWVVHLNAICKKTCAGIGVLKRTKPFVHSGALHTIYKALFQPYFDYCSPVWRNCGV